MGLYKKNVILFKGFGLFRNSGSCTYFWARIASGMRCALSHSSRIRTDINFRWRKNNTAELFTLARVGFSRNDKEPLSKRTYPHIIQAEQFVREPSHSSCKKDARRPRRKINFNWTKNIMHKNCSCMHTYRTVHMTRVRLARLQCNIFDSVPFYGRSWIMREVETFAFSWILLEINVAFSKLQKT